MPETRQAIRRFGSHEALIEYVKGHFMSLQKATIPIGSAGHPPESGMVLHFAGGDRELLSRSDAEVLLNDGVLSRLAIRIELA